MTDHSDQNFSTILHMFGNRDQDAGHGQASQASGSNHSLTDQCHVNNQMLAQLNALCARLDNMESSIEKKG